MIPQRKAKTSYSVLGVMAGSSMDGLDLAHVVFTKVEDGWKYQLGKCQAFEYPSSLFKRLKRSAFESKAKQEKLDVDFGVWIAECTNEFKRKLPSIDLLGVHGHTVIHKPKENVSWQLGNGSIIATNTQVTTITDFRTKDISLGGQGAPLVPFGDYTLFSEFDSCLNLGGIANISIKETREAWDICPCNQVLNYYAEKLGTTYDDNGTFASQGAFNKAFYQQLASLEYFHKPPPKSLPNNFIGKELLDSVNPKDGLFTYCQLIAEQIQKSTSNLSGSILITGGGSFNRHLVQQIEKHLPNWKLHIPDVQLVSFKEALVFGFLALKRWKNETNVLSSVTGASKDCSSGVIHLPE